MSIATMVTWWTTTTETSGCEALVSWGRARRVGPGRPRSWPLPRVGDDAAGGEPVTGPWTRRPHRSGHGAAAAAVAALTVADPWPSCGCSYWPAQRFLHVITVIIVFLSIYPSIYSYIYAIRLSVYPFSGMDPGSELNYFQSINLRSVSIFYGSLFVQKNLEYTES